MARTENGKLASRSRSFPSSPTEASTSHPRLRSTGAFSGPI